jgi:hypothetical protein
MGGNASNPADGAPASTSSSALASGEARDLAQRRAAAVQRALLSDSRVDATRVVLLGVEVGDVARERRVPVSLSLTVD